MPNHPHLGRSTRSTASSISNVRHQQPASLARRLLFPHVPPGSDLPPLFLSPDCPPELNDEVYDLISLALRAFVNTWWAKLTRYDKEFLPQITNIVTHVVRSLEQRVLDADLSLLVYGDIPVLVTQHYRDYRQAVSKLSTSYATGGALSLPQLFHQLQPHMAVSSDGTIDEEYFRQVFDHILRECLPSEDYAPEAERFIIREIMLSVVVKDVIPRITQPWFIHKTVLDILGPSPDVPDQPSGRLDGVVSKSSIIVILLSAIQRLSGACITLIHAYKQMVYIIPIVNQTTTRRRRESVQVASVQSARDDSPPSLASPASSATREPAILLYPDLTRGPLGMVSEVLRIRDRLAATALVHFVALFCRSFQTFMNKLLCYVLCTYVLSASTLLQVVRLSKRTLFPNGYPAPGPVEPTAEEQVVIREELVKRLTESVPGPLRSVLLGDGAKSTVESAVDAVSVRACNVHLAVLVLDAIVVGLFPEMGC